MNSNRQTFQYQGIIYTINKNGSRIVIQIMQNKQVNAEQTFTFEQIKGKSPIFYLLPSLQSIYDVLISLANENQVTIKERKDFYMLVFRCQELPSIELAISKTFNTHESIGDNLLFKEINKRLNTMGESIDSINTRLMNDQNTKLNNHQYESMNFLSDN